MASLIYVAIQLALSFSPEPLFVDFDFQGYFCTSVITLSLANQFKLCLVLVLDPLLLLMHVELFLTFFEAAYPSCLRVIQRQRHLIDSTIFLEHVALLRSASLCMLAAPLHMASRSFFHAASRLVLEYIAHCVQYIHV